MFRTRTATASGVVALVFAAAIALAGCAGPASSDVATLDKTPAATSAPDDAPKGGDAPSGQESLTAFTSCMRDKGIDMPDPDASNPTLTMPTGVPKDEIDAAFAACQDKLGAGSSSGAEASKAGRQLSGCMRRNGVEEFPDPAADGSLQIDPKVAGSDEFKAAARKCGLGGAQ